MANRFYVLTFLVIIALAAVASAQTFTTLYNFTGGSDGGNPYAGVIQDKAGNLYSTAVNGGHLNCGYGGSGCGMVYKLKTSRRETVLHRFSGSDGEWPYTSLIQDHKGNFYGTTETGGSSGYGSVFKINAAGKETVLHSFAGGTSDGCDPYQGLVMDNAGNLYGTTNGCGSSGYAGTIFKIDSTGKETILHNFAGGSSDGMYPIRGHLIMDKAGDLYGLAERGGSTGCDGSGCGVLYELKSKGKFTIVHSFAGGTSDGCDPMGSVMIDEKGNFYGTTWYCGSYGAGTVWRVSNEGKETILHDFFCSSSDGCYPQAGVTQDSKGNLYGLTTGQSTLSLGTLYELSKKGTVTLLHRFSGTDGEYPIGELLRTADGTLFGTAAFGGTSGPRCGGYGCGTVWSYVP